MNLTPVLRSTVKKFGKLSYVKNVPEGFVQVTKRTVPEKVYGNRFGAPDLIKWRVHPKEFRESIYRPWDSLSIRKQPEGRDRKALRYRPQQNRRVPDDQWFFFLGDKVVIKVGKDRDRVGVITQINRDLSLVWVEGLNKGDEREILESEEEPDLMGNEEMMREQPLNVLLGEVALVNYMNQEAKPKWIQTAQNEIKRMDEITNTEINLPQLMRQTQEYNNPAQYRETPKDTPWKIVKKNTYLDSPEDIKLTFEESIMNEHGIELNPQPRKTYFY